MITLAKPFLRNVDSIIFSKRFEGCFTPPAMLRCKGSFLAPATIYKGHFSHNVLQWSFFSRDVFHPWQFPWGDLLPQCFLRAFLLQRIFPRVVFSCNVFWVSFYSHKYFLGSFPLPMFSKGPFSSRDTFQGLLLARVTKTVFWFSLQLIFFQLHTVFLHNPWIFPVSKIHA